MQIGPKEKLECLKFISQIHRSQFTERSKYEWKIVFTTLTFYVLFIVAVYSGKIILPSVKSGILAFLIVPVMSFGLATVIAIYLGYVHISNNKNKTFAENAENAMWNLLKSETPQTLNVFSLEKSKHWVSRDTFWGKNTDGKRKRGRWGWIGQVVTISIFALSTFLLIYLYLAGTPRL